MLDGPLPKVPARGMGEPGDIISLGILFRDLPNQVDLDLGEGMFIINGSPVASAALADVALAGRSRLNVAETIFALAAEAIDSSKQHYDLFLDAIWGDHYQSEVLQKFRELLQGRQTGNLDYQAPVSFRSTPRLLGWLRRVQHSVEECAEISISHASNNPIFVKVDSQEYKVISNGGYHDPLVAGSIDSLARAWADLVQLATHQINRLTEKPEGILSYEKEPRLTILYMSAAGCAEEARNAAQTSLISLGPVG
jgi:histidine ammonia-lyase